MWIYTQSHKFVAEEVFFLYVEFFACIMWIYPANTKKYSLARHDIYVTQANKQALSYTTDIV